MSSQSPSAPASWATVSTTINPSPEIHAFIDFHLAAGASHVFIYLDRPDHDFPGARGPDPRVTVIRCDDAYWAATSWKTRPERFQHRQDQNATDAYQRCGQGWLAHIDIDEFLFSEVPLKRLLRNLPQEVLSVRAEPWELLLPLDPRLPVTYFRGRVGLTEQERGLHQRAFPRFWEDVPTGFLSHIDGKVIVRTGVPDLVFGVHRARVNGGEKLKPRLMRRLMLAHCPNRDRETFAVKARYRMYHGGYRPFGDLRKQKIFDMLERQLEAKGEDGMREVFDEFTTTRTEMLIRLEEHGLLVAVDRSMLLETGLPGPCPQTDPEMRVFGRKWHPVGLDVMARAAHAA
ncbi:glycosyltransferase family 2 protein [Mangrovicoccus algicola]|uniref:Glycosyltransferase family 2 protein n=1 Tax=Mangrovicoccus algicola TaxID=2771008 RepID=A0A8J6YQF3_9RHOB|nr:glycosyltransferase family 2 protein [Mangrovicoccus algicola]MBE3637653.1 glycosyltransferase family 2 protein [Mangrovicoccus algicola]